MVQYKLSALYKNYHNLKPATAMQIQGKQNGPHFEATFLRQIHAN